MFDISSYAMIFFSLCLCYLYVLMSEFFLHKKCNYFHETAVAILVGLIIGIIITKFTTVFDIDQYGGTLRDLIMLGLLPPMLFEDGYNIKKRKFFQNISYINLYGVLGTVLNLTVFFWIFYAFSHFSKKAINLDLIRSVNNAILPVQIWQIILLSSSLCSIDTVVAEKIVNPERYPKLFSIIFGESIFKDTFAVTMFDSVANVYTNMGSNNTDFDASAVGMLVGKFLEVVACSILIGIGTALFTTFLFRKMRFLMAEKGVAEVALILMTGYGGYILSEWAEFSGVISMLFCGITLSHFNVYNLTPEGKSAAKISISTLSLIAEGLLFFLLGAFIYNLQFDENEAYTFSWSMLLITLTALFLSRLVNIYLMSLIGRLIVGKKKWRLNMYEYEILTISGMVRGAVPFALILTMPTSTPLNFATASIQNTVVIIVFLTTLFLNSLMPKFLRNRLKKIDDMVKSNINHPSIYDSLLIEYQKLEIEHQNNDKSESNTVKSERLEKMQSKAEQIEKIAFAAKLKSTTHKYWKRFEEGFLKPLLIFDYHSRKQEIKMEKIRMRKEEVEDFWRRFRGENMLDPDNEENNKFIDVRLVENDDDDNDNSHSLKDEERGGEFIIYTKKKRNTANVKNEQIELKDDKSKTEMIKALSFDGKGLIEKNEIELKAYTEKGNLLEENKSVNERSI